MDLLKVLCMTFVLAMAAVLIMAAIRDSRTYIIDNRTVITVLVLAVLFHGFHELLPADLKLYSSPLAYHLKSLGLAAIVLALTTGLFALRVMGGGDVKLITVMMLWSGPDHATGFLLVTAMAGGFISAIVLIRHRLRDSGPSQPQPSHIVNPLAYTISASGAPKVPYGIGICAGGLYVAARLLFDLWG